MRPISHLRERTITMGIPVNPLDRHVVIDLETTGLSPRHGHRVIEIGAVADFAFGLRKMGATI